MLDLSNVWPELKVIEKLGEGSFGKVYKCEREELGMKLYNAVKVISIPANSAELESVRKECRSDAEVKSYYSDLAEDFSNEIRLMLMLKGAPNVVSVDSYKIVEHEDGVGCDIYICMEYLTCFSAYTATHPMDEKETLRLGKEISNALAICAEKDIIHRDIKPDNIFVDSYGSYKLGDFGVARRLEGSMSMMSKKGTYSYMAPEVYKGGKYDSRADVYSLGMVMYKLLNRNVEPFADINKTIIGYKERNEALERRMSGEKMPAPVDASPDVAKVILKACEFKAENRYATVAQFNQAITDIIEAKAFDEATVADTSDDEKTVIATGLGLGTNKTDSVDNSEKTVVADDTTNQDTTVVVSESHVVEEKVKPEEKQTKNKKPVAIIAAAILAVIAIVAIVAVASKGGFKKETGDSTELQTQLTDTLEAITEVLGVNNRTEEAADGTTRLVTENSAQAETVTEKATETATEGKTEAVTSGVTEVPATVAPTKPKTEATTPKPSTTKKQETTTKKKPVTTKAPTTKAPATTKAPETTKAPVSKYDSVSIGDYITFGSYEQDNNTSNGKEKIKWRVLDKKDGKLFVISEYALDCQPYNTTDKNVTWETCTLRKWLNNEFINTAFSSGERAKIQTTTVTADSNPDYSTNPGNNTQDKAFLLSDKEMITYFGSNTERQCKPTAYAKARGVSEGADSEYKDNCHWWLRTPGETSKHVVTVCSCGGLERIGCYATHNDYAVRPAMWITL